MIASEVNVKDVRAVAPEASGFEVTHSLSLAPREFSNGVRPLTSKLFSAAKSGEWEFDPESETVLFPGVLVDGEPVRLEGGQFSLSTAVSGSGEEVASVLDGGTFVVLDTAITDQLEAEGYARDLVRSIQDARKDAGLHVADRVRVRLVVPEGRGQTVEEHKDMIASETLALELEVTEGETASITVERAHYDR